MTRHGSRDPANAGGTRYSIHLPGNVEVSLRAFGILAIDSISRGVLLHRYHGAFDLAQFAIVLFSVQNCCRNREKQKNFEGGLGFESPLSAEKRRVRLELEMLLGDRARTKEALDAVIAFASTSALPLGKIYPLAKILLAPGIDPQRAFSKLQVVVHAAAIQDRPPRV